MRYLKAKNKTLYRAYLREKKRAKQLHEIAWQVIIEMYNEQALETTGPRKLSRINALFLKLILRLIK